MNLNLSSPMNKIIKNHIHTMQKNPPHTQTKNLKMVIFGPPGSGKGTQSVKIERDYGIATLSTGNLLRQAILEKSVIGREVENTIQQGHLVKDEVVLSLVKRTLETELKDSGWLLDGFPRNLTQASLFEDVLHSMNLELDLAVCLDVDEDEIVKRICERWIHVPSGRTYHTTYKPPLVEGYDDHTGEALVQREDDRYENVRRRLTVYKEQTSPLLDYYYNKGLLRSVAAQTSDEGYVKIKQILDEI